jgi:hypothetical protein
MHRRFAGRRAGAKQRIVLVDAFSGAERRAIAKKKTMPLAWIEGSADYF